MFTPLPIWACEEAVCVCIGNCTAENALGSRAEMGGGVEGPTHPHSHHIIIISWLSACLYPANTHPHPPTPSSPSQSGADIQIQIVQLGST